jgi:KTSC domain
MAKQRDLKEIMNARLNEAMEELKKSRERNLNTFERNTADDNPEGLASSNQPDTWSIEMPNDVKDVGAEVYTAPTTNPKRPRAYTVGYNHNTNTLIVIFRHDVWWQYNNVPATMWLGLKNSASTGKYLRESGLDTWGDMGPADMDSLSASTKERFSYSAAVAGRMQSGKLPTFDEMMFGNKE